MTASATGRSVPGRMARGRSAWRASVGKSGPYSLQPVAVGDKVYVSSHGGDVMALDATSGRTLWKVARPTPS